MERHRRLFARHDHGRHGVDVVRTPAVPPVLVHVTVQERTRTRAERRVEVLGAVEPIDPVPRAHRVTLGRMMKRHHRVPLGAIDDEKRLLHVLALGLGEEAGAAEAALRTRHVDRHEVEALTLEEDAVSPPRDVRKAREWPVEGVLPRVCGAVAVVVAGEEDDLLRIQLRLGHRVGEGAKLCARYRSR